MDIKDIQNLIDNKLKPNVSEWTRDAEDVLSETGNLTDERRKLLNSIRNQRASWHDSFPEKSDNIVADLKRVIKKMEKSPESIIKGEGVVMTKENVFIIYSHQNVNTMLKIKEFIREGLGFEPKTLDIAECTGVVWDAFTEKSAECQKAVALMSGDDEVVDMDGNVYKQARPNVLIELGYMIHKCGLDNVTIVYTDDCNEPSDISNLVSVRYGTDQWTESLRKQLNRIDRKSVV